MRRNCNVVLQLEQNTISYGRHLLHKLKPISLHCSTDNHRTNDRRSDPKNPSILRNLNIDNNESSECRNITSTHAGDMSIPPMHFFNRRFDKTFYVLNDEGHAECAKYHCNDPHVFTGHNLIQTPGD